MSEIAPTFTAPKTDERAELARLEAQVAKKRTEVEGNEAFGKYDEFIGPLNRGLDSHHSYHAQRPSEGIVRDGTSFRQAESGQFASAEAYEDQNGTAQDHYDTLSNFTNEGVEDLVLENMGIMQLAKEQARLEKLNDVAGINEVRAVFDQRMLEEAAVEGSGITDADLDEESRKYDGYVAHFKGEEGVVEESPVETISPDSEVVENATITSDASEVVIENEAVVEPASSAEVVSVAEVEQPEAQVPLYDFAAEVTFNGEKMNVTDVLTGSDGTILGYEITGEDGTRSLKYTKDLTEGWDEETSEETESDQEKSPKERLKELWSKSKDFISEKFTLGYMKTKWFVENSIINKGIPEDATDEEAEKVRKRNRILLVAGSAALVIAGVALASNQDAIRDLFDGTNGPGPSGGETPPTIEPSDVEPVVEQEVVPPAPEVIAPNEAFNIPSGGGAEQLFNTLGIDSSKWYANQETLLANFPSDFYRMEGGGVGISHQGFLSQGAQDAINALR